VGGGGVEMKIVRQIQKSMSGWPFRIIHMFLWNLFLKMADITSKNVGFSSWITLYKSDYTASRYGRCIKCKYKISPIHDRQNDIERRFYQFTSVFSCENHSSNSARTYFIYVPPTLYNINYWQLRKKNTSLCLRLKHKQGNLLHRVTKRRSFAFPAFESPIALIQHQFRFFEHTVYEVLMYATCPA
jgi:hypothetical protein